jgi:integrase
MLAAHVHSPRLARAVTLMLEEGLRVGEVAAADWADLDVARRQLGVRGKGYRGELSRIVPLSAQSTLILGAGPRRGPIVPTSSGGRYQSESLGGIVADLIRDSVGGQPGDGRTAHALRHSAATHMIDEGGDVRGVQRILGHRSVATTERYISGASDTTRATIEGRWYPPKDAA